MPIASLRPYANTMPRSPLRQNIRLDQWDRENFTPPDCIYSFERTVVLYFPFQRQAPSRSTTAGKFCSALEWRIDGQNGRRKALASRMHPDCGATQFVSQRGGRQDIAQRVEGFLAAHRSVQDGAPGDVARLPIGKIQRPTEFATGPLQEAHQRTTLDVVVGSQRGGPQPVATIGGDALSCDLTAGHGQQLGTGAGLQLARCAGEAHLALPNPDPNRLRITHHLKLGAHM